MDTLNSAMSKQMLAVLIAVLVLAATAASMPTYSGTKMASETTKLPNNDYLDEILSGKLRTKQEARLVRKLLHLKSEDQPRMRRDTSSAQSEEELRQRYKRSLQRANLVVYDLHDRVEESFKMLCQMKKNHYQGQEPELANCPAWANFQFQNHKNMNIPAAKDITIHSSHTSQEHVKNVFGESLSIVDKFHYVIANVTTMESEHVCTSETGKPSCVQQCDEPVKDGYKFWCKLDYVHHRIRQFKRTVKNEMRGLNIDFKEVDTVVSLTATHQISEITRVNYNFASLYQMQEQMKLIKTAVGLMSNYI